MTNNISINTQSSIKTTGKNIIYFDPYKIEKETHDADYIFITHDHYDHFDIDSINKIIKEDTIIVVPEIIDLNINNKVIKVLPNNEYKINDIVFNTIPSYNIDKQFHPREKNYVGYIINIENTVYYIAGDTDVTDESKNVKCDVALIPIGGYYTMDYKEASNLINIIKPKIVIPIHYGSIIGDISFGEKFKELLDKEITCEILIK